MVYIYFGVEVFILNFFFEWEVGYLVRIVIFYVLGNGDLELCVSIVWNVKVRRSYLVVVVLLVVLWGWYSSLRVFLIVFFVSVLLGDFGYCVMLLNNYDKDLLFVIENLWGWCYVCLLLSRFVSRLFFLVMVMVVLNFNV